MNKSKPFRPLPAGGFTFPIAYYDGRGIVTFKNSQELVEALADAPGGLVCRRESTKTRWGSLVSYEIYAPHKITSKSFGSGDTPAQAWANAAGFLISEVVGLDDLESARRFLDECDEDQLVFAREVIDALIAAGAK